MMWLSFPLGVLAWTFAEYVLHRFDGHGMRGKTAFSREHLAHHADPLYFAPWWKKSLAAIAVLLLFGGVGGWLFGAVALPFSVGFGGAYLVYEWIHRRIHTHAPVGAYGGWVRRHHLVHHFVAPKMNHGVTTSLWDHVFGTWQASESVRVPRKHAPGWLVAAGEVRPGFEGTYRLAGRG
jgi:sterol desaturase/sphingolipid hydroxylase (fatty acid hydroxylase superfamily)